MRHIPLKNAFNVRDMGGYPTTDGKSTKWGMLYRSDALSSLTEEDWQVLKARKIHTVIDLRSLSEISAAPVQVPEGTEYDHFSLMPEMDKLGMDFRWELNLRLLSCCEFKYSGALGTAYRQKEGGLSRVDGKRHLNAKIKAHTLNKDNLRYSFLENLCFYGLAYFNYLRKVVDLKHFTNRSIF